MTRVNLVAGAAGIWAFAFIAFFGTQVTTFDPTLRLVAAVAYGLPVIIGASAALALRPHSLDLPILGLMAAYAVVSVVSVDPTASLETLALTTAYASLFLVVVRIGPGPIRQGLVIGCALAGSAWLGIMALRWIQEALTWVALDGSLPPLQARSGNPWLSTDAVAALAILVAPYHLRVEVSALRRILIGVATVGAAVVIPLSGGRVAWAAILVAAASYYAASHRELLRTRGRAIGIALAVIAVAGIGLFMTGQLGTLSGRTFIWQTALAVIGNHPFAGAGPGAFSWVRLAEAPELLNPYPVYHAHNVVLQTLADGGVLLLAALSMACVLYVRHVARGHRFTRADASSVASLIGFALILMLDELTQLPALTALAIGSAALLARDVSDAPAPRRAPTLRALTAVGCMLLVAIALPATLGAQASREAAADGNDAALSGDWESAQRAYVAAAEAWPVHASYELALGLAAAHLLDDEAARAHYERAAALSPGDPRAPGALGILGASSAARADALRRASRLGAMDPQYAYRLALELLASGDREGATTELGRAALLDPQLLVAVDVAGLGLDLEALVDMLRVAVGVEGPQNGIGPRAVEPAIDVALARAPTEDATWAALALARSGDVEGARAQLERLLRHDPHDRAARLAARALARVACDLAAEARHDRLLGLLAGGYASLYLAAPEARASRDHVYREMGLGDYQPPQAVPLPVYAYEWPAGYLPPSACEGQP